MAINPYTRYPGQVDAPIIPDYPFGKARNVTAPGAQDGTPWEKDIVNDLIGFNSALLDHVGAVPDNIVEKVGGSQYLSAILKVIDSQIRYKGVVTGLKVENDPGDLQHDIKFNPGFAFSADNLDVLIELDVPIIKQLDALWVAGNNQGGRFGGTLLASTTYHLFVIYDPINNLVDAGFDDNITATNRDIAYTEYARVASLKTDGSSQLYQFYQCDNDLDLFILKEQILASDTTVTVGAQNLILNALAPQGISFEAHMLSLAKVQLGSGNVINPVLITSTEQTDILPTESTGKYSYLIFSNAANDFSISTYRFNICLDPAGDYRLRRPALSGTVVAGSTIKNVLLGWRDTRGKI